MAHPHANDFFDTLPVFDDFEGVTRDENYRPVPQDWWLATADIVDSTKAILEGRYKAVNMAGASVISAVLNAIGNHDLPFVFGGDGALVAVPEEGADAARRALAATRAWVRENMGLRLRVALVPVEAVRKDGHDVRIGLFQASGQVRYAMFSGGGALYAEQQMRDGLYDVDESLSLGPPDLTGLSCRWNPVQSRNGMIVSIIALPRPSADPAAFRALVTDIVTLSRDGQREGHPLPAEGPPIRISTAGCRAELRTAPKGLPRVKKALSVISQMALMSVLSAFDMRAGAFDARVYREDVSANSDFRKYDDGLKMTLDIGQEKLNAITRRLEDADRSGTCRFGIHVQDSALVTCLVPTPLSRDHMHFIDGGAGGYAMAASQLKKGMPE